MNNLKNIRRIMPGVLVTAVVSILFSSVLLAQANQLDDRSQQLHIPPSKFVKADSSYLRIPYEQHSLRLRMASSPKPVDIKLQGRLLCVKSNQGQLLPVYTSTGAFYAAFRLTKGTNWINGLPRGNYYINGKIYNIL
ncbi:MAG: hypothetical protein K6F94_00075 [Bacteroidaceae bacterium]|nr:hypothetical protein [Bacteroidaceae bacterium]